MIVKLIEGIEKQGETFEITEWIDKDYFKESEIFMITQGFKARRPDRSFLVVAQWLEKSSSFSRNDSIT